MKQIVLVFPHQLFEFHPLCNEQKEIWLFEDPLFFYDEHYPAYFHQQKLVLHRATMKQFQVLQEKRGAVVKYFEHNELKKGKQDYIKHFKKEKITRIETLDVVDFMLQKRLIETTSGLGIEISFKETQGFLLDQNAIGLQLDSKHYFFTSFYISMRKKFNILVDEKNKPIGKRWTFDTFNRKKFPKSALCLKNLSFKKTPPIKEAIDYVKKEFSHHFGNAEDYWYIASYKQALDLLDLFLKHKLFDFGTYQDAIVDKEPFLFHSLLSMALNIGLITPQQVIDRTLNFALSQNIPLNSLEGFIRQILGWREYVRAIYVREGVRQRTSNFWDFKKQLPQCFYSGQTGILPVDQTINRLLRFGYCHHIERLMVLGNFMLLCEIEPNSVYKWFMELFLDSYDWVMVPNVYGMSQYADGGLMITKPYISSSNYILKMSNYSKGPWCQIWDSLFWRFVYVNRSFFMKQPRLNLLIHQLNCLDKRKLNSYLKIADQYLNNLK